MISERLHDDRLVLVCGSDQIIVTCSKLDCPEAGRERERLEAQRRIEAEARALEENLREKHGCAISERLQDSRLALVCGNQRIVVTCSKDKCPEVGQVLERRRGLERQGCTVNSEWGGSSFSVSCGFHSFQVRCTSSDCREAGEEITARWKKVMRERYRCTVVGRSGLNQLDLSCRKRRRTVVCTSIECGEARS